MKTETLNILSRKRKETGLSALEEKEKSFLVSLPASHMKHLTGQQTRKHSNWKCNYKYGTITKNNEQIS